MKQTNTARRKRPRKFKKRTKSESLQFLASLVRTLHAWEEIAPGEKFRGMGIEDFRKVVELNFYAHAEVWGLEWELERLTEMLEGEGSTADVSAKMN